MRTVKQIHVVRITLNCTKFKQSQIGDRQALLRSCHEEAVSSRSLEYLSLWVVKQANVRLVLIARYHEVNLVRHK
jgi:hypothetical protein